MSLIKQLWLAITFIVALAASGSFMLSTLSSKHYLEEQLQLKNIDNATSLALSMSQMPKDPVTLSLLISAQFDAGHYHYIRLTDPDGKTISEQVNMNSKSKAPKWFTQLVSIQAQGGVADIQDGWRQYGTISLASDVNFAYDKLWDSTIQVALLTLLIGILACYIGGKVSRKIISPLDDVVHQATAIGENRFISIDVPKTTEFKAVASAMNALSRRIKKTLAEEAARLEQLRFNANFDPITGLMNHDYFINRVDASISHEETFSAGVLLVCRLTNLASLDQSLGHQATNILLKRIGDALENQCKANTSLYAGRLSGTDFSVFSNQPIDAYTLGNQIQSLLVNIGHTEQILINANFVTVVINIGKSATISYLSPALESAVKLISFINSLSKKVDSNNTLHVIDYSDLTQVPNNSQVKWQRLINAALTYRRIKLEQYPVINQQGELIHHESPVRLQLTPEGKWYAAGEFITWASKLNLMSRVDEMVLETAINMLNNGAQPIGLNVSAEAICNPNFIEKMLQLIHENASIAQHLHFEVAEKSVFEHLSEFRNFCRQLKALGSKVGIEHVGATISRLGELHDLGLDYMKIDVSIIRDIDSNEANKALLRGLCMIAHSIGMITIAEGVQSNSERAALKLIGVDGMTGPGIRS